MQHPSGQGKLVMALEGEVFDVAVDLRRGSPTFGQWRSFVLTEHNAHQVYVPPGFAHGFLVLSRVALFAYKCTALYSPSDEIIVRWDDPALGISWPEVAPLLSPKDRDAPPLSRIPLDRLPTFEGES
jgi:dTDP-4-dehydrorhamnose 3,5-epimerase